MIPICGTLTLIIITPLIIYRKAEKFWWQWKWAKIAVDSGLTQADIDFALRCPGGTPRKVPIKEMIAWFEQVKERGKIARRT